MIHEEDEKHCQLSIQGCHAQLKAMREQERTKDTDLTNLLLLINKNGLIDGGFSTSWPIKSRHYPTLTCSFVLGTLISILLPTFNHMLDNKSGESVAFEAQEIVHFQTRKSRKLWGWAQYKVSFCVGGERTDQ